MKEPLSLTSEGLGDAITRAGLLLNWATPFTAIDFLREPPSSHREISACSSRLSLLLAYACEELLQHNQQRQEGTMSTSAQMQRLNPCPLSDAVSCHSRGHSRSRLHIDGYPEAAQLIKYLCPGKPVCKDPRVPCVSPFCPLLCL